MTRFDQSVLCWLWKYLDSTVVLLSYEKCVKRLKLIKRLRKDIPAPRELWETPRYQLRLFSVPRNTD